MIAPHPLEAGAVLVLIFLAACGQDQGTNAALSPGLAPIDSLRTVFEQTVRSNDYEAQALLYVEDAVVQPSNRRPRIGRAAIRAGYRRYLTSVPDATIDYEPVSGGQGGDHAWEAGSAFETGTRADGVAHADSGKYLWVWTRTDDGWRIAAHSFSLDFLPIAPPDSTAAASPGG